MKNILKSFILAAAAIPLLSCQAPEEKSAISVVRRTFGELPRNVSFEYTGPAEENDSYTLSVADGKLTVSGTSAVALCKGFHDFIRDNGYGCATWSGSRLALPRTLPDMKDTTVVTPYDMHLFYNVCTFGYTTGFWDWEQWEKEIDWLALHGFDMPLAPVATEAILARVYTKMGLSWDEISEYFSGPAHFPWMRMGNMCSMDGGMSPEWHESQITLQHRILDRMYELGMDPVFQGFAGFVPEAIGKHFPEVTLTRADWHGLHNQLLNAKDSLFQSIGTAFIKEWEAEFEKGKYYLIDSFNEMDIPFGERGTAQRYETIKSYASATYESVRNANPDAVWVMQGWMFGRDRKRIWDPESVEALLDGAPDDKLIIIDLAVDFNEYVWRSEKDWDYLDGFSGKRWIWSTTPNFGGRSSLKGVYDFYLNAQLDAMSSPNRRRLEGYGCSPEGIETNEPLYEAISSAGWSSSEKDPREFLAQYFASRYGCAKEDVRALSDGMLGSVYNNFTNADNFDWVGRHETMRRNIFNVNQGFYDGVASMFALSGKCADNELYVNDVLYFSAFALAAKANELNREIRIRLACRDFDEAIKLEEEMTDMLLGADRLLESHPLLRMQRWLDLAEKSATNPSERDEFRHEALRIVTTWDADDIHDYAARLWSGLIRDYYVPRIKAFYEASRKGESVDFYSIENEFIENTARHSLSPVVPAENPVSEAENLVRKYVADNVRDPFDDVAGVYMPSVSGKGKLYVCLTADQMRRMKGFEFTDMSGGPVVIEKVQVGNFRTSHADGGPAVIPAAGGKYFYHGADSRIEDQTVFTFTLKAGPEASGLIRIIN